jgi:opacity protein-like surface antigen
VCHFYRDAHLIGGLMKTGLGASTLVLAAFAMGGQALAADASLPPAQPRVALKAPSPPPPLCQPYWSLFGGWNSVRSISDTLFPGANLDDPHTIDFKHGYVVGGAVGRCIPGWNWLRVEGEISYRRNKVNTVTVANEGTTARSGYISALAVMANAWADFEVMQNLTVHAGGGIGGARVKLNINNISIVYTAPVNDGDTVFAFQLGGGAAWHVMPNVAVTLDYRYFQAVNPSFSGVISARGGLPFTVKDDYRSHSIMAGIRVGFGGP